MKHNFLWTALLLVVVSVGLVACEEPYHQKDEQYYFISANINIPYWQEAQAGLLDAAAGYEHGGFSGLHRVADFHPGQLFDEERVVSGDGAR